MKIKKNYRLNPAPIFDPGALRNERVFEEFFEICQIPNEAEVELLGIVGEVGAEAVLSWCKYLYVDPKAIANNCASRGKA